MNISSPVFHDGERLPANYSRLGGDQMLQLVFENAPEGAQSLALICHDPDAPRPEGWTHWLVWNIDPSVIEFPSEQILANVVQGKNDWGENHWGGPQPPSGTHRYIFYLYALDTTLELPPSTMRNELETAMKDHILETATLTGLFSPDSSEPE